MAARFSKSGSRLAPLLLLFALVSSPMPALGFAFSVADHPAACHEEEPSVPVPSDHVCCQIGHSPAIVQATVLPPAPVRNLATVESATVIYPAATFLGSSRFVFAPDTGPANHPLLRI